MPQFAAWEFISCKTMDFMKTTVMAEKLPMYISYSNPYSHQQMEHVLKSQTNISYEHKG